LRFDPIEFAKQWEGKLHSLQFTSPEPMLPTATTAFFHYAGIPKSFSLCTYQEFRFDFLTKAENLAEEWKKVMAGVSMPVGWKRFWRFGDITYTQGGAWLCIEELTGRIVAIDVDLDDPLYTINVSVSQLMECFRQLLLWSKNSAGAISTMDGLLSVLPDDSAAFWSPIIQNSLESGCDEATVQCE